MTVFSSSVLFAFFHNFILCWKPLNATESCLRPRIHRQEILKLNYENLKIWVRLFVLLIKGKAQETLEALFSATWIYGHPGTFRLVPPTHLKLSVTRSVEKINKFVSDNI